MQLKSAVAAPRSHWSPVRRLVAVDAVAVDSKIVIVLVGPTTVDAAACHSTVVALAHADSIESVAGAVAAASCVVLLDTDLED